jgi:hypothetical protein
MLQDYIIAIEHKIIAKITRGSLLIGSPVPREKIIPFLSESPP